MIKINIEQLSEAWFQIRLGRITGTRFKDLMSAHNTAGYNNLIADLSAEILTESNEDVETYTDVWMQRGTELEPEARMTFGNLMDVDVETIGFAIPDEFDPYHDWVGVSPDGLLHDDGMLEIKCPKRSTHMFYISNNQLPSTYFWQVQGQLFVTKRKYCDFMSYYPKMKPFIIRVYPDKRAFENITRELDEIIPKVKNMISNYKQYQTIEPVNIL